MQKPRDFVWYISMYRIYRRTFIRLLIWNYHLFLFFFKATCLCTLVLFGQVSFLVRLWSKADVPTKGSCPKCKSKDEQIMNKNHRTLKKQEQNNNRYPIMRFHLWTWTFAGVMGRRFQPLQVGCQQTPPTVCSRASALNSQQHVTDTNTTDCVEKTKRKTPTQAWFDKTHINGTHTRAHTHTNHKKKNA